MIVNPDMTSLMDFSGLLAAADGIGFLIFFLIAFVSWLINFLSPKPPGQGGRPAQQRKHPQNGGQGKPVQNEIDRFLQQARELVDNTSQEQEKRRNRDDDIVVVEAPRRQQPPQQRRASPPPPQRRNRQEVWESQVKGSPDFQRGKGNSSKQSSSQGNRGSGGSKRGSSEGKPGDRISGRQMQKQAPSQAPGSSIGQLRNVGSNDQNLLAGSRVGELQSVFGAHLSQTSVHDRDAETLGQKQSAAFNMARNMRSPSRVRDAVIMNEILSKPLALRRRHS